MGTNYYLRQAACSQCGHVPAELHVGKSSAGWNFGLRIYPKIADRPDARLGTFLQHADSTDPHRPRRAGEDRDSWDVAEICELDDWRPLFAHFSIFDEYNSPVSIGDMIATITGRSHPKGLASRLTAGPDLMGPHHDPARERIDTFAGKGTYDLCAYEFS